MISVIIPVYNDKYFEKSIVSVADQIRQYNGEIIVIDDGSEDPISLDGLLLDIDVKLYRLAQNRGAAFARNYGVDRAIYDLIGFNDSDDFWIDGKFSDCLAYLNSVDVGVYFFQEVGLKPGKISCMSNDFEFLLSCNFRFVTPGTFIRKSKLNGLKFDSRLRRNQDGDFFIRLALNSGYLWSSMGVVEVNYKPKDLKINIPKENYVIRMGRLSEDLVFRHNVHLAGLYSDKINHWWAIVLARNGNYWKSFRLLSSLKDNGYRSLGYLHLLRWVIKRKH